MTAAPLKQASAQDYSRALVDAVCRQRNEALDRAAQAEAAAAMAATEVNRLHGEIEKLKKRKDEAGGDPATDQGSPPLAST